VSEIEVRPSLPERPSAEAFSALLGRYLRADSVMVDARYMTLQIEGFLAPWPPAVPETPALRRAYMDSLDAVIGILDAAGATWRYHPHVFIAGEVLHRSDGGQEFCGVDARVTLDLLLPRTCG